MKKILTIFLALFILFGSFSSVLADEKEVQGTNDAIKEVNSFELFWPVVAGKTRGTPLYGLKRMKEKVRGWFIFGKAEKADYEVSLATKRVVEAEKLLKEGEDSSAIKTLDEGEESVVRARDLWNAVETKAEKGDIMVNIKKQLTNIETFLNYLENKNEGAAKERINRLNNKVTEFIISF